MLSYISVARMHAAFMRTAPQVFVLAFFRQQYFFVAFWVSTVHVAFARLTCEVIASNHYMFFLVNRYADAFIEYIALAVPKFALHFRVLSVGHDAAVKLSDILKAFLLQPAREFLTADTAGAVCEDFLSF